MLNQKARTVFVVLLSFIAVIGFTLAVRVALARGVGHSTNEQNRIVYRINCGGSTARSWDSDQYFSGGEAATTNSGIDTADVRNPAPQAVYQSERYGQNFLYTFPDLNPGTTYLVRLHFVEFSSGSRGERLFDVLINRKEVLTNFDIFGATGDKFRAIVKEFNATPDSSGNIRIVFKAKTDPRWAVVQGIEILPTN